MLMNHGLLASGTKLFDGSGLMAISLLLTSALLIGFTIMALRLRHHLTGTLSDIADSVVSKFVLPSGGGASVSASSAGGAGVSGANSAVKSISGGKAGIATVAVAGLAGASAAGGEFFGRSSDDGSGSSSEQHDLVNDYDVSAEQGASQGEAAGMANSVMNSSGGTNVNASDNSAEVSSRGFMGSRPADDKTVATGSMVASGMAMTGMQERSERESGRNLMQATSLASTSKSPIGGAEVPASQQDGGLAVGTTGTHGTAGNGVSASRGAVAGETAPGAVSGDMHATADQVSARGVHAAAPGQNGQSVMAAGVVAGQGRPGQAGVAQPGVDQQGVRGVSATNPNGTGTVGQNGTAGQGGRSTAGAPGAAANGQSGDARAVAAGSPATNTRGVAAVGVAAPVSGGHTLSDPQVRGGNASATAKNGAAVAGADGQNGVRGVHAMSGGQSGAYRSSQTQGQPGSQMRGVGPVGQPGAVQPGMDGASVQGKGAVPGTAGRDTSVRGVAAAGVVVPGGSREAGVRSANASAAAPGQQGRDSSVRGVAAAGTPGGSYRESASMYGTAVAGGTVSGRNQESNVRGVSPMSSGQNGIPGQGGTMHAGSVSAGVVPGRSQDSQVRGVSAVPAGQNGIPGQAAASRNGVAAGIVGGTSREQGVRGVVAAGVVVARNIRRVAGQQISYDLVYGVISFFFQCVIHIF